MENSEILVFPTAAERGGLLRGMKRVATATYSNEEFKFEFCIDKGEQSILKDRLVETTQKIYELDFDIGYQDFWKV